MTDTMTSQNIDLSSWDTLYIKGIVRQVGCLLEYKNRPQLMPQWQIISFL
jgi:hypothetical protein